MRRLPLCIDLAFCIMVLPIMIMIFPVERWYHYFPGYVATVGLWLYSLYALNRFVTVPFLFKGRLYIWLGVTMITLSVIVTYCISCIMLYTPKPSIYDEGIFRLFPNIQQYQQAVWSLFMIVETFSFAVGLLTQANIQRLRSKEVEEERRKAEIALFKAQIKPHFMFNTLNSVYGLFLTGNEKALESLERFISMIRYVHTTALCDFVALKDEVDYIRQYMAMQSLRLNELTTVKLETEVEDDELMVPPMLLITFVENCFKHGVSPVEKGYINVLIRERGAKMTLITENHICRVITHGEHIGIENCKRRLDLQYPGRHKLEISNNGEIYKVKLSIYLSA
ncbi:MAG: histidine kinase [Muribaculaceae bacterium]|nr:histidine kinase [Muribaculaceae bacterium]MDE5714303.1 histidine kinase [Muribaculaceae bacterium]